MNFIQALWRGNRTPSVVQKRSSVAERSVTDELLPLEQSSSLEFLPPDKLTVVLLGNSWSQRSSVVNLILGQTVFNTEEESNHCVRVSGPLKEKKIVLINTPDLLHPNISQDELTEHVADCLKSSDPGPHVFLLVLQPEDFTENHKQKLCRVLEEFSEQSFEHSLVLVATPRAESPGFTDNYTQHPPLKDMIKMCKYRYLRQKHLELPELLTCLGQIAKENNGHLKCEVYEDAEEADSTMDQETLPQTEGGCPKSAEVEVSSDSSSSHQLSKVRIAVFGKNEDKKRKLCNFILKKNHFQHLGKQSAHGEWRGKPLTVVKTKNMFSLSVEAAREEMRRCVTLCRPGPNVLLLLVKPSDFTEKDRQTLKVILGWFDQDALKHSMVIIKQEGCETSSSVDHLIEDCGGRHYISTENNQMSLMQKMEDLVHENRGTYLTFTDETVEHIRPKSEHVRPALNLVLCGRRGAGKTSAAEAILGQTPVQSVSSECVKDQGDVCGRWVSLVELPALCGKSLEGVMEESLRCISLCDPEGVHAFVLVLPLNPLTGEDKREFKTIQNTFSSRVNDFTVILFTVESDVTASGFDTFVKENGDAEELLQLCGGRSVVLNIKDKQQIPNLLETVEKMRLRPFRDKPCSFTTKTFAFAQKEKIIRQEKQINKQQNELQRLGQKNKITCEEEQSPECLRIVLIGKTGSGKSSSGNTILGRKEFKAKSSQTSVTKCCHKAQSNVNSRPVVVVDTPGLFDSTLSHNEVNDEMMKCISLLAPGPHVFLVVVQIGRFTPEEKETLRLIKEAFGKNAETFTIILLTGGDKLTEDETSIEKYLEEDCDDSFKSLITNCGGRYHVFDNKDQQSHLQVRELISKIDNLVKENGGSCYTNEMLQEAEAAIQKEMERILEEKEEDMRREREDLQRQHEEEMEAMRRRIEEQKVKNEEERKLREKQLEEMKERIENEQVERKKEQDRRDAEDKKKKQQEETKRREWEQKHEALEQKIRSESESKESLYRKLEESREEMRREREKEESKQKEWWEKRHQEDEQRRQEEQIKLRKLQEEYEQERQNNEKKRKEEDRIRREQEEKEKKDIEEEWRARTEEERKLRDKQLKEMMERIEKEQEERKKEQEMRNAEHRKRKEQEEAKRQEWEQKHQALEQKIRSESESKEIINKKLEESREEKRRERENMDKKQKEWWDRRRQEDEQRRQEEQAKLRKLQEEYEQERENYEKKRKEDDQKRREEEKREKKNIEEKYENEIEKLKKTYEEKARHTAEEFNEFKESTEKDFAALIEKHMREMQEKQDEYNSLKELSTHQEKDLKQVMDAVQNKHKHEMANLALVLLHPEKEWKKEMNDLQETHKKELEKLQKYLSVQSERKEKEQIDELKKKHDQEMKALDKKLLRQNKDQSSKRSKMSEKHDQEVKEKQELLTQQTENKKKQMDDLQKEYEKNMEEFKQRVSGEIDKLQKKHDAELNVLKQQQMIDRNSQEEKIKELQNKHDAEMEELKQQQTEDRDGQEEKMNILQKKQDAEMNDLKQQQMKDRNSQEEKVKELQNKHDAEMEELKQQQMKDGNSQEEKVKELQNKHDAEMDELKQQQNEDRDSQEEKIKELQNKHKSEMDELKQQHMKVINSQGGNIKELQNKHDGEMDELKQQQIEDRDSQEEKIKELQKKHDAEMDELKLQQMKDRNSQDEKIKKPQNKHKSEMDELKQQQIKDRNSQKEEINKLQKKLEKEVYKLKDDLCPGQWRCSIL